MPWPIYPALLLLCLLLAWLMVRQAAQFLEEHAGPALTGFQQLTVVAGFVAVILVMVLRQHATGISLADVLRLSLLFAWGIPLVLLDWRCFWLPLRFTSGFWLSGLLLTCLPASPVTLLASLAGSGGMFAALWVFRVLANRAGGEERIGLGDVHLIAGLAAWYGWEMSCLLSAAGLFLLLASALASRQRSLPCAPWLFTVLATVAMGLPQLLQGKIF